MIPFGDWRPDQYDLDSSLAGEASGVRPGPGTYIPWPLAVQFSAALATGACRGGFTARKADGTYTLYAGTQTKLYQWVSSTSWTDVTRLVGGDYNVPDDERWWFEQFGTKVVCGNANDDVQVIDTETGTNFAALGGSPPKARTGKTYGDFLMLGGLTDYPKRVHWSELNNITGWTAGVNSCDIQEFPDGGYVTALSNLETGLVAQNAVLRRIIPAFDSPFVFQFARLESDRGCIAPDSFVVRGRRAFYLSDDGFFVTDGTGASVPIGGDAVDRWFNTQVNLDRIYIVSGAADPVNPFIYWLFPTEGNSTAYLDACLCYNYVSNRWTHATVSASYLLSAATPGYTLEGLDALGYTLDTLPFSLDARFLQGGARTLAGFDSSDKLIFYSGSPMAATVETGSFRPIPGRRAMGRGIIPLTDCSNLTAQVSAVETTATATSFGATSSLNRIGVCPVRAGGAVHRIRVNTADSATWTHLKGVDYDAVPEGMA